MLLWSHRGRRDGLTLTDLCALTGRDERAIRAQIAAAKSALRRLCPRWHILEEEQAIGTVNMSTEHGPISEPTYWLVAHDCPRPPRRSRVILTEPEIISFEELGDEFPGDVPGLNSLLHIAKEYN